MNSEKHKIKHRTKSIKNTIPFGFPQPMSSTAGRREFIGHWASDVWNEELVKHQVRYDAIPHPTPKSGFPPLF